MSIDINNAAEDARAPSETADQENAPSAFLANGELARQEQKDNEEEVNEDAEENTWQPTLNDIAHHIELHTDGYHTLKPATERDISGYLGGYGGHSPKVFRRADILNVLYQKNPPLAAPALFIGIYVGEGMEHPFIHFVWMWNWIILLLGRGMGFRVDSKREKNG